jgi:hypothetical protein
MKQARLAMSNGVSVGKLPEAWMGRYDKPPRWHAQAFVFDGF